MNPRRFAIAYAVCLTVLVVSSGGLFAVTADLPRPTTIAYPSSALELLDRVQFAAIGLLGAYLLPRVPRNRFVWLLLVVGAGFPIWDAAETYGRWRLQGGQQPWDGVLAAWVTNWAWAFTAPLSGLVFLLYPTGMPPSARWRVVERLGLAVALAMLLVASTAPGSLDVFEEVTNPVAVPLPLAVVEPVFYALLGLQLVVTVLGVASVIVRLVRARGVERQQVKWFASAGLIFVVFALTGPLELGTETQQAVLEFVSSVGLTLAIGIAITRHRLYEIDRILSRSLAYLLVVAILATVYLALVVALGAATRALTGEAGDLVVALSTLAVAALFQPLRRRVQGLVDRRFNRARYDLTRTVDGFGRSLRDEVSRDAVVRQLQEVVVHACHPAAAGVLLFEGRSP